MALRVNDRLGLSLAPSAAISWVLTRETFVAVLVVPRDSGHQLLGIVLGSGFDFGKEVLCLVTAECRCQATVVQDLNVLVLPQPVPEAQIAHAFSLFVVSHRGSDLVLDLDTHPGKADWGKRLESRSAKFAFPACSEA